MTFIVAVLESPKFKASQNGMKNITEKWNSLFYISTKGDPYRAINLQKQQVSVTFKDLFQNSCND